MLPPAGARRTEQQGRASIHGQSHRRSGSGSFATWRRCAGLLAGEEMRCRSPSRLVLEMDVGQRLPVGVADDEAGPGLLVTGCRLPPSVTTGGQL